MDFIERLFGVSPDGGDGTLEFLYVAVALVIVAMIAWRALRHRSQQRTRRN
jgi:hypothetical protein